MYARIFKRKPWCFPYSNKIERVSWIMEYKWCVDSRKEFHSGQNCSIVLNSLQSMWQSELWMQFTVFVKSGKEMIRNCELFKFPRLRSKQMIRVDLSFTSVELLTCIIYYARMFYKTLETPGISWCSGPPHYSVKHLENQLHLISQNYAVASWYMLVGCSPWAIARALVGWLWTTDTSCYVQRAYYKTNLQSS